MFVKDALLPHAPKFFVLGILSLVIYKLWQNYLSHRGKLPLPPSPPGLPILGNLIEFVKDASQASQHILLQQWAEEHGEIVGVKIGPMTEYYVNSDRAVKGIFDRESAATAERPRWIVSNEQICNKMNVLLLNSSEPRWKNQRRIIHSCMTSMPNADAGLKFLHFESAKFLNEVASGGPNGQTNLQVFDSLSRYTYSTFTSQSFGMEIPETNDPAIGYIHETGLAQILGTLPGSYIVDVLPFLDGFPMFLKPWEQRARERFRRDLAWCMERLNRVKHPNATDPEIPQEAFLRILLQESKKYGVEPEEAAYLSLMVVMAAADTSQMSTWSFFEAMLQFPDVQKKAQKEIDDVVGDRIPVFEDLESIPYVRCIMKEVWRWRPPVALGHPHVTTKELEYGGYRIPAGSRIRINAWAIGHDANRHEDPERFWPERYAHDKTTAMQSINSSDVTQRDHFAFGSGRRVCPGYHVAERSFAVSIMRILWAFDIKPLQSAKLPLDPSDYRGQPPGNPNVNLPVTLVPRSDKSDLIKKAYADALESRTPMAPLVK
ncbi:cytochrome P450 [Penicillium lividum]|nr:cytochrome P450 [Penicillium lividum]